jgi:hypothetical protein
MFLAISMEETQSERSAVRWYALRMESYVEEGLSLTKRQSFEQ